MVRNTAREIAVHLAYELSFTDKTAEELVAERLSRDGFAELAGEDELYSEAPNAKQAEYIRALVCGVADHAPELDEFIARYAKGCLDEVVGLADREDHLLFHAFSCEAFFLCRCRIYKAERRRARCSASLLILR